MQKSKFIDGAVLKKSDTTLVKHVLFEMRMSKRRRKMTLLPDKLSKTRRKMRPRADHVSKTRRKMTLLADKLSKARRKTTPRADQVSKTRRKMTLLADKLSKTRRKMTLLAASGKYFPTLAASGTIWEHLAASGGEVLIRCLNCDNKTAHFEALAASGSICSKSMPGADSSERYNSIIL